MEKISLESPKTGSDLVLETLRDLGIDTIFGYPGGAVLPFMMRYIILKAFATFLGRHEQGCLHEAEGYAKSTGKLGVAVVTSGPGATNAITGIADAMSDSVPLGLYRSGGTSRIGKDAFQEADIVELPCQSLSTITKFVRQLISLESLRKLSISQLQVAQGQSSLTYLKTYLLWKQTSFTHQK